MKITAAVAQQANQPFEIQELELDTPRANEILVRVLGVGICHTDLISRDQQIPVQLPAVLGHEGAGIVEAVGENVSKVAPGDQVVMTFLSCGHCPSCTASEPSYCYEFAPLNFLGRRSDGSPGLRHGTQAVSGRFFGQSSFASHALVEEHNVVKVDVDESALPLLGALGCGFQTGAGAILNSLNCQADESLVIIGGGAVGMSAVMAAAIRGCTTVLIEPNALRRDLAMNLGATAALDGNADDINEQLAKLLPRGINKVFDTTGIASLIERFVQQLCPRGMIGLVAAANADTAINLNVTQLVIGGITVKGILEGDSLPDEFIPQLVEYYKAGKLPVEKISKTFPLSAINDAIVEQKTGGFVKAVLVP